MKYKHVSAQLQRIAGEVSASLDHAAGEPVTFFLLVQTSDGVVQYVSNAPRDGAKLLMTTQLEHWARGKADIPAHYNPDLKQEKGS